VEVDCVEDKVTDNTGNLLTTIRQSCKIIFSKMNVDNRWMILNGVIDNIVNRVLVTKQ